MSEEIPPWSAVVKDAYGSATEVLRFIQTEIPAPDDDEVVVRVHAAGVDPSVWHLMTGSPYLIRLMGFGLRRPKVREVGSDLAGVVETIGRNVSQFRPGDAVFGVGQGSFAEYARARVDKLAPMPATLSFDQAASVPVSGITAVQGLRDAGKIEAGQKVLIIGAGGGVGTFAVQIASAWGAEVTGVASSSKADLVRSIGADSVIDYTKEDFADGERRYDLILDTAGRRPLSQLRRALTDRGTLVIVGGEGGGKWLGGTERQLGALILSPFVAHNLRAMFSTERQQDLLVLKDLIESGKVTPVLDRTYPLSETPAAIDHVKSGRAHGKVVITI
ncbi:MAG: NAD(P)-dependent alcohol dehydrogenase [Acidimicrobiia bacterium]